jgi:hypothetical protein
VHSTDRKNVAIRHEEHNMIGIRQLKSS